MATGDPWIQTGERNEIEAAADTVALADHLGWDRFHLVGFSMTGMVVERLAINVPDRIKSVVAIGSTSAAGVRLSDEERQFFVDVITDDDKCRQLADDITGCRFSEQWQECQTEARPRNTHSGSGARLLVTCGRSTTSPTRRVICQRRSKSTPLAGVKMHHLMRFSPALAVVPVVHRRDPRCFV